jgi:hypothetical protein
MTRRLIDAVRAVLAPTAHEPVHFHNDGMHGEPAVCYDVACGRPKLDIG